MGHLIADEVLQRKLHSLTNVDVVPNAQTTEITGDGPKMHGLVYIDSTAPPATSAGSPPTACWSRSGCCRTPSGSKARSSCPIAARS